MIGTSEELHESLKLISSTDADENPETIEPIVDFIHLSFLKCKDLVPSDLEFAVLTLQKTFQTLPHSSRTLKCRILVIIADITILFLDTSISTAHDVVDFLIEVLGKSIETTTTLMVCADCLIEFELSFKGILRNSWSKLSDILNSNSKLINKKIEILALMANDKTSSHGLSHEGTELNCYARLVEELENCIDYIAPPVLALTLRQIAIKGDASTSCSLVSISNELQARYPYTFDLCVLQSIFALQELAGNVSDEIPKLTAALTHPGLSVGHTLFLLEWINSNAKSFSNDPIMQFNAESKHFDGADVKLKKTIFSVLSSNDDKNANLGKLMRFCIKNPSARAFAAVFRIFRVILWFAQEKKESFPSFLISHIVSLANSHSSCLPHIVDFVKYLNDTIWKEHSGYIVLNLIDSFDEITISSTNVSFENLLLFFTEASTQRYQFCQPRVIIKITMEFIRGGGSSKILQNAKEGFGVLELCQSLIRNQDYEIFLPELQMLLSALEESHGYEDVRHRAGMLRYLISQVAKNSVKDAFDVDLSGFGSVEEVTHRLIEMNVLLDQNFVNRKPVLWSTKDKQATPVYLPIEVRLLKDQSAILTEVFGLRIDITMNPECGRVETIFIPHLKWNEKRKSCIILELSRYCAFSLEIRATMTTIEGRVLLQRLDAVHMDLELLLNPVINDESFDDLWNKLETESEVSCTSGFLIENHTEVLQAIHKGTLQAFRYKDSATDLCLVTPDNNLILTKVVLHKNLWHAEILVEHPTLLCAAYYLLTRYSKQ